MKILFFDGFCNLCHWAVRWVGKHDTKKAFYFAPLAGTTAKEKLQGIDLPDSIVYYEDGNIFLYSKACFRIAWQLGGIWCLVGWLGFLPDWMLYPSDLVYKYIAKRRARDAKIEVTDVHFLP